MFFGAMFYFVKAIVKAMLFEASKRCSHHLAVSNQVCTTCAIRHMLRVKSGCVHDYNNPLPGSWIHHVCIQTLRAFRRACTRCLDT